MPCKYLLQGKVAYCTAEKEKIFSLQTKEESKEHADEERYAGNG